MKFKTITLAIVFLIIAFGIVYWYWLSQQKPPTAADKELLFRVKIANVDLRNSSLLRNKQPMDFVEVKLLGQLYEPPKQFTPVNKQAAHWNTPIDAAVADFSAFKADDSDWMLENFVPNEQREVRSFLNDKDTHEQNKKNFETRTERYIIGEATYKNYAIVFVRDTGQTHPTPLVFEETPSGYKRTNALSKDETFDIVFSALHNGGEVIAVQ